MSYSILQLFTILVVSVHENVHSYMVLYASVCLSIYICTWLISQLKKYSQDKAFWVQGDFTLPSPSVPCLLVGENTEDGLPKPLYNLQGIWWQYSCSPRHRTIILHVYSDLLV